MWEVGVPRAGESNWGKWGQTVIDNNKKFKRKVFLVVSLQRKVKFGTGLVAFTNNLCVLKLQMNKCV